jgi:type IV secretion system protein VirB9
MQAILAAATIVTSAAAEDRHAVERILYDPSRVVRFDGKANIQGMIQFAEDEHIENVAIGDSQAWQVTPNKRANLLFVKPLSPTAITNMTVVTDRHTYVFDLVATPNAHPFYILSFEYPTADPAADGKTAPTKSPPTSDRNPYAMIDPSTLNLDWHAEGARGLLPRRIYDDGKATFLEWGNNQALPALLIRNLDGKEGPINFASRGNLMVIDGVPSELFLRLGSASARLTRGDISRPVHSPKNLKDSGRQP